MRGTTGITLQPHQMLCLPRKMTRIIDPRDIWNVIYNARSNRHHPPTSPNTAPATQNDSHDWCPSHMTRHLQRAEQQISSSNITKCCACHAKWLASSILVTYETLFTMRGGTGIARQPHQILRLPRKMTRMIDPRDIWNVIYNARNNRHHPPTSPNTAPATQNCTPKSKKNLPKTVEASIPMCGRFEHDPTMIRTWSEHDPTMKLQNWTRPFAELTFPPSATHFVLKITTFRAPAIYPDFTEYCACNKKWHSKITKYCACHAKWLSWLMSVTHDTSFTMRGATDLILQHHQMLRLPRKMTRIIYPRDIWNVIYNARSNKHHPPTSPNAAPATKNDAHHWLSSHMKRHLQCAEQQASPSNLTKYCACHAKLHSKIKEKFAENSWSVNSNARPIRAWSDHDPNMIRTWSEHDPTMKLQNWTRPFAELTFPPSATHFVLKLQHFALRLSTQISPNTAPATKNDTPRSPNTAPATQNDSHDWCPSHMTRHLQCAEQQISSSNITKCCACHARWLASSILVTYETLFTMRGGTGITRQPHQILRLPRKMTLMIDLRHIWNVIYNARSNRHHPPTSPNTAPATQKCTPKSKRNSPRTVEASIPMRGRFDHDPNMIRPWSEHDPTMIRAWTRHLAPARSPRLLFALRRRILYWKLQHFALRLSIQISPNTAPATKTDTPRSPNTAPATQNDAHDWCPSHMTRHLQCAEQQISSSNITKCCACHARWLASSILVTYETLFTMRGGTGITRQPHQILRLPRKMTLMIDLRHIWNVIYNARSNRHHPPTSPNTAPATQKCTPKSKRNSPRTVEASIPMRGRFDHDPNMIRPWSDHELVISHPPVRRGYFSRFGDAFCIENYNISRSGYLLKFHRILRLPRKVTLRHHQILRLPRKMTLRHHQMLRLPRKVTLRHHQILRLPRKVRLLLNCYWTELLLSCYWVVTKLLLSCYWTVTELLLNWYWTVTELLLNWPVTELLLNWTVTGLSLNCYWTDLLLNCYWTVTELTCYRTVTELTCYWTELLLNCYWTVTELTCYSAVTELLLNCYFALLLELLLYWTLCIFKSP